MLILSGSVTSTLSFAAIKKSSDSCIPKVKSHCISDHCRGGKCSINNPVLNSRLISTDVLNHIQKYINYTNLPIVANNSHFCYVNNNGTIIHCENIDYTSFYNGINAALKVSNKNKNTFDTIENNFPLSFSAGYEFTLTYIKLHWDTIYEQLKDMAVRKSNSAIAKTIGYNHFSILDILYFPTPIAKVHAETLSNMTNIQISEIQFTDYDKNMLADIFISFDNKNLNRILNQMDHDQLIKIINILPKTIIKN